MKDSTGATASASLTLSVTAPLAVSTTSLPPATTGTTYSATITASGGTGPYTWSGTGVDGLTFSATGLLSGTPSPAGTFTQNVTVKDSTGATASASLTLTVTSASGGGTSVTLMQHTSKDAGTTSSSPLTFPSNNSASNWVAVSIRAGAVNEIFTVTDTNGNTYRKAIQFSQTVDGDTIGMFYAEKAGGAHAPAGSQLDGLSGRGRVQNRQQQGQKTRDSQLAAHLAVPLAVPFGGAVSSSKCSL